MKVKIYTPVLGPKNGKGLWFTVNGAADRDRDAAIRKASKHVSVRDGECEIKRVYEEEYQDYELEHRPY